MIRGLTLAAALLSLAAPLTAQSWCAPQHADTGSVAFTGVTLWDGTGSAARAGTTILIHGERITAVFKDGSQALPAGTTVRPFPGKYVIPGLIDAHVHVGSDVSGRGLPRPRRPPALPRPPRRDHRRARHGGRHPRASSR